MKQFISGLIAGAGIGLLLCGLVATNLVGDFESTLYKYDTQIDDFYAFTHSYGFETIQDVIGQTVDFYRATPLIRQTMETLGMGQLGQLLQDIDENLDETIEMSEDLYDVKTSMKQARSWILYMQVGGIVLLGIGIVVAVVMRSR
jgi:hypothetical protein